MFRHPGHRTPGNESGRKPTTASDHRKEPPGRDKPLTQARGKLTNLPQYVIVSVKGGHNMLSKTLFESVTVFAS